MRRVLVAVVIAGAFCTLIGLGVWQLNRLHWKEALIAAAEERPSAAPVPAPGPDTWGAFQIDEWRYRPVTLTGTYGPAEAYFWIALSDPHGPLGGPGAMVLAPFTTTDGWSVLVNRGFVPDERRAPDARPGSEAPAGTVTIEALVRRDDPPSFVTPAADLQTRVFFARDIDTIMAALGADGPVAPYQVDLVASATPASGLPQAGESRITFTNSHLQYALTWFGIAAALLGVVIVMLLRGRRGTGPSAGTSTSSSTAAARLLKPEPRSPRSGQPTRPDAS